MILSVVENISNIDLVLYVFVAIFCIIGLFKGFVNTVYSLVKGFVSIIGAYFLTTPVVNYLSSTSFYSTIKEKIFNWTVEKAPSLNNQIDIGNYKEQIVTAAEEAGIPDFLQGFLSNSIKVGEEYIGKSVGDFLSDYLSNAFFTIISFIVLFILISLIVYLIFKIFRTIVDRGGFRIMDRLLGLITNGVVALFIICLLFILFNGIGVVIPSIDEWLKSLIYDSNEGFSISKYIYENNPLKIIFDSLFK